MGWSDSLLLLGAGCGTVGALWMAEIGRRELVERGRVDAARKVVIGAGGVFLGFVIPAVVMTYAALGWWVVVGSLVWGLCAVGLYCGRGRGWW